MHFKLFFLFFWSIQPIRANESFSGFDQIRLYHHSSSCDKILKKYSNHDFVAEVICKNDIYTMKLFESIPDNNRKGRG